MTTSDSTCRCVVLASGAAGQVTTCPDCGTMHVAIPQLSLRLTRETFRGLAGLMARAQRELDASLPQAPATHPVDRALH